MQQASDIGINPFALQLLAESFADEPDKFGGENVAFLARAHNDQQVWFVMSKTMPTAKDFDGAEDPCAETMTALEALVKLQAQYAKLLNDYDGGQRMSFESAAQWIARLRELKSKATR
jgi:hypothetical protein